MRARCLSIKPQADAAASNAGSENSDLNASLPHRELPAPWEHCADHDSLRKRPLDWTRKGHSNGGPSRPPAHTSKMACLQGKLGGVRVSRAWSADRERVQGWSGAVSMCSKQAALRSGRMALVERKFVD
jgi:hypothetical protein